MPNFDNIKPYADFAHEAAKHGGPTSYINKLIDAAVDAYETEKNYMVEVTDDGVGFDMSAGYDETKHVGIKNIRGRIEAMCGGSLTIESEIGSGTKATIRIPKEATENDSNNS